MARYIECEAAIKAVSFYDEDKIRAIPAADVVPVVRCKDCKYRQDDDFCGGRGWPAQLVPDDGYCDSGVRNDGDGDV